MMGNFPPHEAFAIGGTNSVRGYEEGVVGSGRSCLVGCGEVSFPLVGERILISSKLVHFFLHFLIRFHPTDCFGHMIFFQ